MSVISLYMTALPIFVAAIIVEGFYFRQKKMEYSWTNTLVNFILAIGYIVSYGLALGLINKVHLAVYPYRLFDIPNSPLALVILFFLVDFTFYWIHRTGHTIRWIWALHSVHHSAKQITFSVAYRLGWTNFIAGSWLFLVPLTYLGFDPKAVAMTYSVNLLYQFWLHTETIPKLGWLEKIINTPSHHRVHHATNPEYLDRNYAGVFIFWDKIFGTFAEEKDGEEKNYGLVHQVDSLNPLVIVFAEYFRLFQDLKTVKNLREFLGLLYQPPGWLPNGKGTTSDDIRRQAREAESLQAVSGGK